LEHRYPFSFFASIRVNSRNEELTCNALAQNLQLLLLGVQEALIKFKTVLYLNIKEYENKLLKRVADAAVFPEGHKKAIYWQYAVYIPIARRLPS
jgi:hypothetical protein